MVQENGQTALQGGNPHNGGRPPREENATACKPG
jgi:hypothetical protein